MLLYCLKSKEMERENANVVKTKKGRIMLLSNMQCVTVKNQDLSKSKKLVHY